MLAYSTTLNPGPLNITPANQQNYGNVISKIQKSDDFTNYVQDQIKKSSKNGTLNVPTDNDAYSFPFKSGDLLTSLHNVDAGLSGVKSQDGSWNLHVTITDTYNYDLKTNYRSGITAKAITTVNNSALVGQQVGLISNYPVDISFDYTYKPH